MEPSQSGGVSREGHEVVEGEMPMISWGKSGECMGNMGCAEKPNPTFYLMIYSKFSSVFEGIHGCWPSSWGD